MSVFLPAIITTTEGTREDCTDPEDTMGIPDTPVFPDTASMARVSQSERNMTGL